MVGPHGVPWPACRSALPGSHCRPPYHWLAQKERDDGRGAFHATKTPQPTPATGKHSRTYAQKMGLLCKSHKIGSTFGCFIRWMFRVFRICFRCSELLVYRLFDQKNTGKLPINRHCPITIRRRQSYENTCNRVFYESDTT